MSSVSKLLIGCPVQKREWIIDKWFMFTEDAARNIEHEYLFVLDANEQPLNDLIDAWERDGLTIHKVHVDEVERQDSRNWNHTRYHRMVELRNILLAAVRNQRPEYFLSLDSDILLDPEGINVLFDAMEAESFHAVGGKAFMTRVGVACPSYAMLNRKEDLRRTNQTGIHEVDVIMAIKLMGPSAYQVDYVHHRKGEDIGWSKAARDAGLRLGWEGNTVNAHVMRPEQLPEVLAHGDPRA